MYLAALALPVQPSTPHFNHMASTPPMDGRFRADLARLPRYNLLSFGSPRASADHGTTGENNANANHLLLHHGL